MSYTEPSYRVTPWQFYRYQLPFKQGVDLGRMQDNTRQAQTAGPVRAESAVARVPSTVNRGNARGTDKKGGRAWR